MKSGGDQIMRRPRFRIRTLMLAVAAVAVLIAAESMLRRSMAYRALAVKYGVHEQKSIRLAGEQERAANTMHALLPKFDRPTTNKIVAETGEMFARWVGADRRRAAYYAAMKRKYSYAASHPWLPVVPDPPEPE